MNLVLFAATFALFVVCPSVALPQTASIVNLGGLNGGGSSVAWAVNQDGTVVVGQANDGAAMGFRAFRWTQTGGMTSLGTLPGTDYSIANGVSGDGSVVVGWAIDSRIFPQKERAFRWTPTDGIVNLGFLNGGEIASASGVSGDGSVVVGFATDGLAGNASRAFRWTQAGGMVSLGVLNSGNSSFANAVSRDGTVVVGTAADGAAGNQFRAFRWTQLGGIVSLGTLNGGGFSGANGVSGDGSVVVGLATDGAINRDRAFRWTQVGGMVSLGVLGQGSFSSALGVSSDGKVVVGFSYVDPAGFDHYAFRWTQATGMQSVEDWLRTNGVSMPVDSTAVAHATNSDGSVVVGSLKSGLAFLARVQTNESDNTGGNNTGGSGLITLQDLSMSLSGNTTSPAQAASLGNLVLNGAHSRPLARRVEPGKSCVWTSGDLGRDDHDSRDGRFGLAEIGGCHALASGVQGALSIGQGSSRQDLVFNGRSDVRGTYGIAELLANVPGSSLWASAALLYQSGDLDARRGYLNAGTQDYSSGNPGVETAAVRLRLDWENAARFGSTSLTPYAGVSYSRTRVDSYVETGGGFPASFDARKENSTELHLGAEGAHALSSMTKLIGRLEAAHRFESSSSGTTGAVLGLFSFNLPGQAVKRDWLRAGIGFDTRLGGGTLSAILNATTSGPAPSYWVNLSYQMAF